jgi:polyisoprenoid-binding protein YceI
VVLPIVGLGAALVRWGMQGSGNAYTAVSKQFFIPDPDVGWQVSPHHPIWLGLDVIGVIAGIAGGLVIAGWWLRRREARLGRRLSSLRAATWVLGVASLAPPIAALASGGAPPRALDTVPVETARAIAAGIVGIIDAPAGRYEVVEQAKTPTVTAKLSAGHETFPVQFTGVRGSWQGDPHDLSRPIGGEISIDAATVETGIDLRSSHARDEYLLVAKYPRISVALDRVLAASQAGPNSIAFRAHGTLGLIGKTHEIEVTGTMKKADAAALARLGVAGDVLLVQADFSVAIKETALAKDAGDFDGDQIPIHVSLVMRHTSG